MGANSSVLGSQSPLSLPMQVPVQGFNGMYQEHALPKASRKLVAAGHGMLDMQQPNGMPRMGQQPHTTRSSMMGGALRSNPHGMAAGLS